MTWPSEGFVPQDLICPRWSLSYPGANFSSATVTMTRAGVSVPVTVITRTDNGFGDNTLGWEPADIRVAGETDVPFTVSVTGMGGAGVPSSYSYTVTAFNPGVLGNSSMVAGSASPSVSGEAYSFNPVPQADAYELRVSRAGGTPWTEGAETVAAILDNTAASYGLTQTAVKRSGSRAFHLTFPDFASGEQGFEVNRDFIPSAGSRLLFHDLFRFSTTGSRLSAEISENNGSSWTEVWWRNGSGSNSSSGWDGSFQSRSVSLGAYAGKLVRVRFVYRFSGSTYLGTDTNLGVFLDDVSVSGATELVSTTVTPLPGGATSFTLDSSTAGAPLNVGTTYFIRIRPNVGTVWFGDGPLRQVVAQFAPVSPYDMWHGSRFTASDTASGLTGKLEDFDHDGMVNLLEYAFGKNPKASDSAGITAGVVSGKLAISFPCDSSRTDINYIVQSSPTLATGSWTDIAMSTGGAATLPIASLSTVVDTGSGLRTVTVTDATSGTASGKRFLRVKVVSP